MPLLTSPIDGSPMRQINRYGVEIDVCPASGGIWLDKGELEKIMALLREDAVNNDFDPFRHDDDPKSFHRHYKGDDDDDDYYRDRKKRGVSRLMDIFDF